MYGLGGSGLGFQSASLRSRLISSGIIPSWTTPAGSLGTTHEASTITSGSYSVSATNADSYAVQSGSLPTGASLNTSTGAITGPTVSISEDTVYTFTIRATSNTDDTTDRQFSIEVSNNVSPSWSTAAGSLGSVNEQSSANFTVEATDEDGEPDPISYSVVAGSLPSGLSLNSSTGAITGTTGNVSEDTTSTFTIRASDGLDTSDRQFQITVSAATENITPNTRTGYTAFGSTNVNRSFVLTSGDVITRLAADSDTVNDLNTSKLMIMEENSTSSFTVRAIAAVGSHTGSGMEFFNIHDFSYAGNFTLGSWQTIDTLLGMGIDRANGDIYLTNYTDQDVFRYAATETGSEYPNTLFGNATWAFSSITWTDVGFNIAEYKKDGSNHFLAAFGIGGDLFRYTSVEGTVAQTYTNPTETGTVYGAAVLDDHVAINRNGIWELFNRSTGSHIRTIDPSSDLGATYACGGYGNKLYYLSNSTTTTRGHLLSVDIDNSDMTQLYILDDTDWPASFYPGGLDFDLDGNLYVTMRQDSSVIYAYSSVNSYTVPETGTFRVGWWNPGGTRSLGVGDGNRAHRIAGGTIATGTVLDSGWSSASSNMPVFGYTKDV